MRYVFIIFFYFILFFFLVSRLPSTSFQTIYLLSRLYAYRIQEQQKKAVQMPPVNSTLS